MKKKHETKIYVGCGNRPATLLLWEETNWWFYGLAQRAASVGVISSFNTVAANRNRKAYRLQKNATNRFLEMLSRVAEKPGRNVVFPQRGMMEMYANRTPSSFVRMNEITDDVSAKIQIFSGLERIFGFRQNVFVYVVFEEVEEEEANEAGHYYDDGDTEIFPPQQDELPDDDEEEEEEEEEEDEEEEEEDEES